ncbi:response regulator transcription factor [Paenibacillus filicis]|uniref:Response regulator transcription factor n=1 Tax=Paenibacillus filicis TaxID=669464 RepID=A0ABU9DVH8_9BACL
MNRSLLIIDSHPLTGEATRSFFQRDTDFNVLAVLTSGMEALQYVDQHKPFMVFLDPDLEDMGGIEFVQKSKERSPDTKIVFFTGIPAQTYLLDALRLGVSGIISKRSGEKKIKSCLECIDNNQLVFPQVDYSDIFTIQHALLTEQEILIMNMTIQGLTQAEIASKIYVSKRSIDNYVKKIYKKLGSKNRLQAIEAFTLYKNFDDV